jgi:hypothetical protein
VSHTVNVADDRCQTAYYAYRLVSGDEKGAWMLRWEYFRKPPKRDYPYPLAHVHVNASFGAGDRPELPKLHIPTRRVPIELVVWHLIAEWGVEPKHDDWQRILRASIEGFEERRSAP